MFVLPEEMAVTNPPAATDATPGTVLDQVPPGVASESCVVSPSERVELPVIPATAGNGLMVTFFGIAEA